MKKQSMFKFVFGTLLLGTVGLISCDKSCYTCTYYGYKEEICESDFDSKSEFKAYIKYLESDGAKCK